MMNHQRMARKRLTQFPLAGGIFLLSVALTACTAKATEEKNASGWPVFQQGLTRTGRSTVTGPAEPHIKWMLKTGDAVVSSPVIGQGGTIYVGSDDASLYALTPKGEVAWQVRTEKPVRGTPAVANDGTVYVGSTDAHLYAVRPDGKLLYKTELSDDNEEGLSSPPIITGDTIYMLGTDKQFHAVSRTTGKDLWHVNVWKPSWAEEPGVAGAAVSPDGTIYTGSYGKQFFALTPAGAVKWKLETGEITSAPAVAPDGTVYVGSLSDSTLRAVAPDGKVKWSFKADGFISASPALGANGTIYVATLTGNLYALSPDGQKQWTIALGAPVQSSFVLDARGTLYVAAYDGYLRAISGEGKELWKLELGGQLRSSPAIGADGTLYIGAPDGHVYAIGGK